MRALCVRHKLFALSLMSLAAACGGSTQEPAAAPEAEPAPVATTAPSEEPASPEAPAPSAEEAAADAQDTTTSEPEPPPSGRDVTYVATTDGLRIDVAGMRFLANATAVKTGGGWGVNVSVDAQANDGKSHSLLSPKNGPLAFGGAVKRKSQSDAEQFGDKREGEGEMTVSPGKKTTLKREWPSKGTKPVANGEILELHVGLWGLGDDAESRKPVKQFFRVRLNASHPNPRAIVEPPPSAGEG